MRIAVCGVVIAALSQQALAADAPFPILRGAQTYEVAPPPYFSWEGVYVGGQVGAGTGRLDFGRATKSLVVDQLRNSDLEIQGNVSDWEVLKGVDTKSASVGGFIGYNTQFEDVVLGVEGNFNYTDLKGSSTARMRRGVPVSGGSYDTTVDATASMHISNYSSLRARAGWAAGRVLPYAMMGFGFGVADISRTATVTIQNTSCSGPFNPCIGGEDKKAFIYGYSAGGGVDVALTARIFLRAEYEYLKFVPTSDVTAHIHAARVGGGFRF
jgi:outer membrane immunogenic protein